MRVEPPNMSLRTPWSLAGAKTTKRLPHNDPRSGVELNRLVPANAGGVPRSIALTPNADGRMASKIYRPSGTLAMLTWPILRTTASLRRPFCASGDLGELLDAVLTIHPGSQGVAIMESSTAGRRIVGLATSRRLTHIVKIASPEDLALQHEAEMYNVARVRIPSLLTPSVYRKDETRQYLFSEALEGRPEWSIATAVSLALTLAEKGLTHGDFAPWNILRLRSGGSGLVDWENGRPHLDPYFDLAHFLYAPAALLARRRRVSAFMRRQVLSDKAPLRQYGRALGLPPDSHIQGLISYLESSAWEPAGHPGRQFRVQLLNRLKRVAFYDLG